MTMASPSESQPTADRFSQPAVWGRLVSDPYTEQRIKNLREMIPDGVRTILDVGCGDGAITNRLARDWAVTGVDMSGAALEHVETDAVQASATNLPFADGSFDLVLSTEMLEHIHLEDYRKAISEMSRVTRQYLLLTVPYREDLRFREVRCPRCGWRGHVWGHQRVFTPEALARDLHGFRSVESRIFGPPQAPHWPRWLIWSCHRLLNAYYWAPSQHPMCERCSNTDFTDTRAIPRQVGRLHGRLTRRHAGMPFWLATLADNAG
jgi:SAM-dependent methyltransferase